MRAFDDARTAVASSSSLNYTTPLCSRTAPTPASPFVASLHVSLSELSLEPVEGEGLIREGLLRGLIHPLGEVVQSVESRHGAAQEHRSLVHAHDASGHLVQRGLGVRVAAVPVKLGLLGELREGREEEGRSEHDRREADAIGRGTRASDGVCLSVRPRRMDHGRVFRGWCGRGDRGFAGGFSGFRAHLRRGGLVRGDGRAHARASRRRHAEAAHATHLRGAGDGIREGRMSI